MKTAIFYKSFLGTTKKYAKWLAEDLKADVIEFGKAKKEIISQYDIVIIASGTYAGLMPLAGFLTTYWPELSSKIVIALAVGMVPFQSPESKKSYQLIPPEIRRRIMYFKLPGKLVTTGDAGEPTRDQLNPVIDAIKKLLLDKQSKHKYT